MNRFDRLDRLDRKEAALRRPPALASLAALAAALAVAVLATACDGNGESTPTPTATVSPTASPAPGDGETPTPTSEATATPTPTPEAAVCATGGGFEQEGVLAAESGEGDAANVGAFRWVRHGDQCERFVIDLIGEDGEPAGTVGEVRVEFLRDLGIVRATFPGVTPEVVEEADVEFDGPLARAAYTVRTDGFSVYVDLHLGEAALARAFVLTSPARVAIDLVAGGESLPPAAARDERIVVLSPREGEASYPLEVTGYARTFEANVIVRLRQSGQLAGEVITTAKDWAGTWGEFAATISSGPSGEVELFAGEEPAMDGVEDGVRLDLTIE